MTRLRCPVFLIAVLVFVCLSAWITLARAQPATPQTARAERPEQTEVRQRLDDHSLRIERLAGRMDEVKEANAAVIAVAEAAERHTNLVLWGLGALVVVLGLAGIKTIRDVRTFRDEAAASQQAAADSQEAAAKCAAQAEDFLGRTKAAAEKSEELHKAIQAAWDRAKEKARALESVNLDDLPADVKTELEELKAKTDLLEILGMPLDAAAYFVRGNVYHGREDYERAIKCYDRAVELKSDYAEAHYNRGLALGQLGRHEEELAAYDRAIELKPDYAEAHNNRGVALGRLRRYEEALAACDRAVEIKPSLVEAHCNRGNALRELDRLDEALAAVDRAIELKPDDAEAHNNRGIALGRLRRYEEALAACNRAIELKPDYAEAHDNRGTALGRLGRYEEALAAFDRAIEQEPGFTNPYYNRACTHSCFGKKDDALRDLRRAIELDSKYRDMAKADPDFENLRDDPEFRKLVGLD